jgi:hypothetical protein
VGWHLAEMGGGSRVGWRRSSSPLIPRHARRPIRVRAQRLAELVVERSGQPRARAGGMSPQYS